LGQVVYDGDTNNLLVWNGLSWAAVYQPGAWTDYSPVVTQGVTVTYTRNYARYYKIGRTVTVQVDLSMTGTGTAASGVTVSLPVPCAAPGSAGLAIGSGAIYDSSANALFKAILEMAVTNPPVVQFRPTTTTNNDFLGSAVFTAALASGDLIRFGATYEAAS